MGNTDMQARATLIAALIAAVISVINSIHTNSISRSVKNLEVPIHVDKVRFETEFDIYKELWSDIVDFKHYAIGLRLKKDDSKTNSEAILELNNRASEFFKKAEKHQPFYTPEIGKLLNDAAIISQAHVKKYQDSISTYKPDKMIFTLNWMR